MNLDGLIDLPYREAQDDCWGLMIRFYAQNFNLKLRNFARPNLWWAKAPELEITRNHFHQEGFKVIDVHRRELKPGDLILMNMSTTVIDHTAAFIGVGKILHHPFRNKSRVDIYAGVWLDRTMLIARHPDIPQVDNRPTADLMDFLPKHKQDLYRAHLPK